MRHILLSCAILLLALSFCLFSMLHIREICKQALCALTSALPRVHAAGTAHLAAV